MVLAALLSAGSVAIFDTDIARAYAESGNQNRPMPAGVSMSVYPIERGYDGAQFVISKQGYRVMVPGLGISPDAHEIAVYRDANSNYWYIDQRGQPTRLTSDQIRWAMAQIQDQMNQSAAQNAAQSMPPVQVEQPAATTSHSGVGSAIVTGVAAAGGAALGAALTNSAYNNGHYYGIPYGTPVWRDASHHAYYSGSHGNRVYVSNRNSPYYHQFERQRDWNDLNGNQKAALYNRHQINRSEGARYASHTRNVSRSGRYAGGYAGHTRSVSRTTTRSFAGRRH